MNIDTKEYTFNQFKTLLIAFLNEHFDICSLFMKQLESADSEKEIVRLFNHYAGEVYEKLGGNLIDEDDFDEITYENNELKREIHDLEYELEVAKKFFGDTLHDDYKAKILEEYHEMYTPWELEELLKNGKELLKK